MHQNEAWLCGRNFYLRIFIVQHLRPFEVIRSFLSQAKWQKLIFYYEGRLDSFDSFSWAGLRLDTLAAC